MAQHTSRQRTHLLTCQAYLDAMKSQGVENSITRQATDPSTFIKPRKADQTDGVEKRRPTPKLLHFPMAVRIQALALAEASISYDRIREITGMDGKLLDKMRKTARDRGYDPSSSMQLKDEYVADPANKVQGQPKKQRPDNLVENATMEASGTRPIPDYMRTDTSSLPPGNWNFLSPTQIQQSASLA